MNGQPISFETLFEKKLSGCPAWQNSATRMSPKECWLSVDACLHIAHATSQAFSATTAEGIDPEKRTEALISLFKNTSDAFQKKFIAHLQKAINFLEQDSSCHIEYRARAIDFLELYQQSCQMSKRTTEPTTANENFLAFLADNFNKFTSESAWERIEPQLKESKYIFEKETKIRELRSRFDEAQYQDTMPRKQLQGTHHFFMTFVPGSHLELSSTIKEKTEELALIESQLKLLEHLHRINQSQELLEENEQRANELKEIEENLSEKPLSLSDLNSCSAALLEIEREQDSEILDNLSSKLEEAKLLCPKSTSKESLYKSIEDVASQLKKKKAEIKAENSRTLRAEIIGKIKEDIQKLSAHPEIVKISGIQKKKSIRKMFSVMLYNVKSWLSFRKPIKKRAELLNKKNEFLTLSQTTSSLTEYPDIKKTPEEAPTSAPSLKNTKR